MSEKGVADVVSDDLAILWTTETNRIRLMISLSIAIRWKVPFSELQCCVKVHMLRWWWTLFLASFWSQNEADGTFASTSQRLVLLPLLFFCGHCWTLAACQWLDSGKGSSGMACKGNHCHPTVNHLPGTGVGY